ncbi:hypothetical protein ACWC2H_45605 [Streptomyces sp. 900105755]
MGQHPAGAGMLPHGEAPVSMPSDCSPHPRGFNANFVVDTSGSYT